MRYLIVLILAFLLGACGGYKPVPNYSNDIFEEPVLVKVKLDPEDPDAGIFLQDEIARMVVNRLNLTLTKDVDAAKSYIVVNSYTINTTPLNYDDNGNVIRYAVNAAIEFAVKDKYGFWSKNIVASEYVSVKAQSLVGTFEKEEAGRVAIKKALDAFILAVMERSRKVGKNKQELKDVKKSKKKSKTITVTQEEQIAYEQEAYNEYQEGSDSVASRVEDTKVVNSPKKDNDVNINIIPTDDDTLIKDATNYSY